jgi:hypothetical protein
MSSTPIADTIRALEEASLEAQRRLQAIVAEHDYRIGQAINHLSWSPGTAHLAQSLQGYRKQVGHILLDELAVRIKNITERRYTTLMTELLLSPPPNFAAGGGHLDLFTSPGQPALPEGARYADVSDRPLAPEVMDVQTARQGSLGDWWLIAAISAVAHWNPQAVLDMVAKDGDDIVVTVANGTYRFPAKLPVNEADGEDAFAHSPDGAILVPSLEKAAAEHFGAYRHLNVGNPAAAMQWLIGGIGRTDRSADIDDAMLTDLATQRQPMVAHNPSLAHAHDVQPLAARHDIILRVDQGYVVTGIDTDGKLHLHNPRAFPQPKPLELATFRAILGSISWCDLTATEVIDAEATDMRTDFSDDEMHD